MECSVLPNGGTVHHCKYSTAYPCSSYMELCSILGVWEVQETSWQKKIQLSKLLLENDIYKLKVMNCVYICPLLYYQELIIYDMTAVFGEIL